MNEGMDGWMDGWMISGQDTVLCWVPVPYLTKVVHTRFQSDSGSGPGCSEVDQN